MSHHISIRAPVLGAALFVLGGCASLQREARAAQAEARCQNKGGRTATQPDSVADSTGGSRTATDETICHGGLER